MDRKMLFLSFKLMLYTGVLFTGLPTALIIGRYFEQPRLAFFSFFMCAGAGAWRGFSASVPMALLMLFWAYQNKQQDRKKRGEAQLDFAAKQAKLTSRGPRY